MQLRLEWYDIKTQLQYGRILKPGARNKLINPGNNLSHFLPTRTELKEREEAKALWFKRANIIDDLWAKTYRRIEGDFETEEERIVAARREV